VGPRLRRDPTTLLHVLDDHVLQQGRLPHAGLADDVDVLASVGLLDPERLPVSSPVRSSDDGDVHTPPARTTRSHLATTSGFGFCRKTQLALQAAYLSALIVRGGWPAREEREHRGR
jgi:hypothetical protein